MRRDVLLPVLALSICLLANLAQTQEPPLDYKIELTSPIKLFDGRFSWCHPRAGTIPAGVPGNPSELPVVVMTVQRIELIGSDIFDGLRMMRTGDLGRTWDGPTPLAGFERRPFNGTQEI